MLDAIIVGGGPAGLSAALVLGRCRRSVLVCDSGHPRNAYSKAMHGFLSRDGTPPLEFLEISRRQLDHYPNVEFRSIAVREARRGDGGFSVTLEDGMHVEARLLLLATGISDEWPALEGFERFYGASIHHCPYCDGWEHRDAALAVHGSGTTGYDLAVELLGWSRQVTLCSDGAAGLSELQRLKLERLGIRVLETRIRRLEGEGNQIGGVRFEDETFLPVEALFFSPRQRQGCGLGKALGCSLDESEAILCEESAATGVPGLFAAGNASRGLQLVIIAAAEGTQAAFAMNQALLEADAEMEASVPDPSEFPAEAPPGN